MNGDNAIIQKDELEKLRLKAHTCEISNENHAAHARSNEDSLQKRGLKIKLLEEDVSRLKEELRSSRNAAFRADRFEEENRRLAEELKQCQTQASRIEDLEQQNKKLATELSNAAIRTRDAELSSTDFERSSSFDKGQLPSMGRKMNYKELLSEHMRVKEQWSTQRERADKLAETIREKNAQLRQWKLWSDEQQMHDRNKADKPNSQAQELEVERARITGRVLSSDPKDSVTSPKPLELPVPSSTKGPQADPGRGVTEHEQDDIEQADYESPQLPRHGRKFRCVASHEETQSLPVEPYHSSSTQDPESSHSSTRGENAIKGEPNSETPKMPSSDDIPEFISARPVRKRKRNQRESQRAIVSKVKVEDLSSSSPKIARLLHASESLDLDDIGDKAVTPRKRRRTLIPFVDVVQKRANDYSEDELLLDDGMIRRNQAPNFVTSGHAKRTMITPASKRGKSSGSTPLQPLQPLNINYRILPNTMDSNLPAKRQRKPSATIRGVEELLEDGESISPFKTPTTGKKGRIHSTDLLDNLLSSSPPPKGTAYPTPQSAAPEVRSIILPPSKLSSEIRTDDGGQQRPLNGAIDFSNTRKDLNRQRTRAPVPEERTLLDDEANALSKTVGHPRTSGTREMSRPASRGSRRDTTPSAALLLERASKVSREPTISPTKPTTMARMSNPPTTVKKRSRRAGRDLDSDDPEQEPYRLRPVATLGLHHFKVNPNFNQGYDFAFTEVVRGKDRQCLPGCVRDECCGKQLDAVAQAIYRVSNNPTIAEKANEDALLEEYLGDREHEIWNMSKQERKDTLAKARRWRVSNNMGTHKSAAPRRNTPPGFWEADFPNTQEDETLKQKQKVIEREKVAERYAEAMRPGGAWLFKDE